MIIISQKKIWDILKFRSIYICHYLQDVYILEEISTQNNFEHFTVEESDFIQMQGKILWVIRIINTHMKQLRLFGYRWLGGIFMG